MRLEQVLPPWPLDEFLAKHGHALPRHDDRRRYARLYYRRPATLELSASLPAFARSAETVSTYSCDLSKEGIAFLSSCELYPQECVDLEVAGVAKRQAVVVRCRRLAQRCYEVGARFVNRIDSDVIRNCLEA